MKIAVKAVMIQVCAQIGAFLFANAMNYRDPSKLALLILIIISCYNIKTIYEAKVNWLGKTVFFASLFTSFLIGCLIFYVHAVSVVGWR